MQLTGVLLLKAELGDNCLHDEKHYPTIFFVLWACTHVAGEPTHELWRWSTVVGNVSWLQKHNIQFAFPPDFVSVALACLFKVSDTAMKTLVISYIFTLYSNVSTDGDRLVFTLLHRQIDNIFQSSV